MRYLLNSIPKTLKDPQLKMDPKKPLDIEFGALDTETGGLDPSIHGLITIGVAAPKSLPSIKPLVVLLEYDPKLEYDDKALEVNGFYPAFDSIQKKFYWWQTNEQGKRISLPGTPEKEAINDVLTYLESHLKNAFIAGCNISFDKAFLEATCKRIDKREGTDRNSPKSFQNRLDQCFSRKTIELQTLALSAHMQGYITLPYTYKGQNTGGKDKKFRKPSVSMTSIVKAIKTKEDDKKTINPVLGRTNEKHDVLEDTLISLQIAEYLLSPWKDIKIGKEIKCPNPTNPSNPSNPSNPNSKKTSDSIGLEK